MTVEWASVHGNERETITHILQNQGAGNLGQKWGGPHVTHKVTFNKLYLQNVPKYSKIVLTRETKWPKV